MPVMKIGRGRPEGWPWTAPLRQWGRLPLLVALLCAAAGPQLCGAGDEIKSNQIRSDDEELFDGAMALAAAGDADAGARRLEDALAGSPRLALAHVGLGVIAWAARGSSSGGGGASRADSHAGGAEAGRAAAAAMRHFVAAADADPLGFAAHFCGAALLLARAADAGGPPGGVWTAPELVRASRGVAGALSGDGEDAEAAPLLLNVTLACLGYARVTRGPCTPLTNLTAAEMRVLMCAASRAAAAGAGVRGRDDEGPVGADALAVDLFRRAVALDAGHWRAHLGLAIALNATLPPEVRPLRFPVAVPWRAIRVSILRMRGVRFAFPFYGCAARDSRFHFSDARRAIRVSMSRMLGA